MAKLKVGIIGCGDVAQHTYLPDLARMHKEGLLDFVAVSDLLEDRVRPAQSRYGIAQAYTDYRQMLEESGVDLVVNLTPTQHHAEVILAAIAAQKHVYTEKPIAATLEEADRIIRAARQEKVVVGSAPAVMTHPELQDIKDMVAKGQIGNVCFARARGSHPGPDRLMDFLTDPSWFYKPGAGPVIDLGIYQIQALTGILGPAKRVTALGGIAIPERVNLAGAEAGKEYTAEVEDNVHILLDFGDACFAYIDATFCVLSAKGPRMELYGSTGVIYAYSRPEEPPMEVFVWDQEHEFRGWVQPEKVYRGSLMPARQTAPRPDWSLASGVEHMVHALAGDTEFLLTAEHARHTLEIILSASQSMREGCAIELKTSF
jgi:predicted dehydrogenase